ncbi:glycosyltransferase [Acidimicrobiia bacterium]|nr:glycosyltransferase [Candidatus Actinomarina sp.]MDA9845260.1 glycosyltransferase [Acidimicrobiia bacterium]
MSLIYLNKTRESWVVDRFRDEWYENNADISTKYKVNADLIWLIAPWTWRKVNLRRLKKTKVICTIHHVDMDKFTKSEEKEFNFRDEYINFYHAISNNTAAQLKQLTDKPIKTIPFWVNQNLWSEIKDNKKLFNKYKLDNTKFLIGSFQRDTEGSDLISPKLSKGPDQFIEIVKYYKSIHENLHIVLTGKRRNYVIEKLKESNIDFSYFEMVGFKELNELYNCLNLYIVSSRVEGGPQSILECGLTKTPIISTDVGVASEILSSKSIYNMANFKEATPDIVTAFRNSQHYSIPNGFQEFRKMLLDEN